MAVTLAAINFVTSDKTAENPHVALPGFELGSRLSAVIILLGNKLLRSL